MEKEELIEKIKDGQEKIHDLITKTAKINNLSNELTEPIYDGVCDFKAYVDSNPKIMWVLKEAYDEKDENGNPCGGGWTLFKEFDEKAISKIRSWQTIIYSLCGLYENCYYDDLDWIHNDLKMVDALKKIAYINLSKMPALSQSGDLSDKYEIWRDVLLKQIDLYNPDYIIFGNTFKYFKKDLIGTDDVSTESKEKEEVDIIDIYKHGTRVYLDAYHPACMVKGLTKDDYVDAIIDAIKENKKSIILKE